MRLRKKSTKQTSGSGVSGHASPGEVMAIPGRAALGRRRCSTAGSRAKGTSTRGEVRGERPRGARPRRVPARRRVRHAGRAESYETQTPREDDIPGSSARRCGCILQLVQNARASVVEAIILDASSRRRKRTRWCSSTRAESRAASGSAPYIGSSTTRLTQSTIKIIRRGQALPGRVHGGAGDGDAEGRRCDRGRGGAAIHSRAPPRSSISYYIDAPPPGHGRPFWQGRSLDHSWGAASAEFRLHHNPADIS